jgi:EAL domain-containing protein (putative c-di-GMP-specific phosphodiesterase class I)/CheY-like chemotaxis protein
MMRVMAVDDEPLVLNAVDRILREAGHQVTRFDKGQDAIGAANSEVYDAAIVDYEMPGANGLSVLRHLKEVQPRCLRILASGALDVQVTVDAVNGGDVAHVLEKPFEREDLLAAIDSASKARERAYRAWLADREEKDRAEAQMLRQCIDEDLLSLAIQPIIDSQTGQPSAYEALLRSKHPVLNSPLAVLEVAERHEMIRQVTETVMRRARQWLERMPEPLKLFVNLHPSDFSGPESLRKLVTPLRPWASRVVFEITERKSIRDFDAWHTSMTALKDLGFEFAVDDLGAGYNSLGILAEVKPSYIKIDMSIVRDVHRDSHKQRLVEVICRFAAGTDAKVIAEGVEAEYEAWILQTAGVDHLQGYLYGRPGFDLLPPSQPVENSAGQQMANRATAA